MTLRTFLAITAFCAAYHVPAPTLAECVGDDEAGTVTCDTEDYQTLRDPVRALQLICDQLASPPSEIASLCEDASASARRWVRSEKYDEAQQTADKLQRQVNRRVGQLEESRRARESMSARIEALAVERDRQRRRRKTWRTISYVAGAVAILSGGVIVGDVAGAYEL